MPSLSHRLKLIFDQLLPGHAVWDICCDHKNPTATRFIQHRDIISVNEKDRVREIYVLDLIHT